MEKNFNVAKIMLAGITPPDGNDKGKWVEELKALDALIDSDDNAIALCQRLFKELEGHPRRIAIAFIRFGWELHKALGDSLFKKGN